MRSLAITLFVVLAGEIGMTSAAAAQTVTHNSVTLNWTTPGDDSLLGTASAFDLRYSTSAINAGNFAGATRWTSMPTPAASGTRQTVTVTGLTPATTYFFALKTGDEVPNWALVSNVISRATLAAPDTQRPAPIANLVVTGATENTASLRWTAVGDDSLTGTAASYDVRWSTSPITSGNWAAATQATGEPAPTASGTIQNFTVNGLSRQTTYYFAMRATDDAGNPSAISNVTSATTPDLTAPASVRDLAIGFVWLGGRGHTVALTVPAEERRR